MQVTKITAPPEAPTPAVRQLTEKQFYDEINYHRAEKMTKKMLDAGLITSARVRANIGLRKEASQ